ncbi:tetratricopeptide repeat protein [Paraferrimonas haliotis]|uniref:Protein SirB1 N-terminal domain-containing protein n=1 Tax=Paraferrimonas haliotis TaxID=2013866 RepID=A0AA37WXT3_9GAMM|nr:tetratricopeptide repeat protein [Paraferrimonas haliotis]GLS82970.1 hypothetical protein GCM10007894_09470 [Paraferrimonas haliotis]
MQLTWCFDTDLEEPSALLELGETLGLSQIKTSQWRLLELKGAVLSQYLIDHQQRLAALLEWFYQTQGFAAAEKGYFSAASADIGRVLTTREGNATALAVILKILAKQLNLTLDILMLPGNCVLRFEHNGQCHYLNPLDGQPLTLHQMHSLIRGELGNHAQLEEHYLRGATNEIISKRLINEIKAGFVVEGKFELALHCCNLLMSRYPEQLQYVRERAFMEQQLGCHKAAAVDLQTFMDKSPKDEALAELLRMQIKELQQAQAIYH